MVRVTVENGVSRILPQGTLDLNAITEIQLALEDAAKEREIIVDLKGIQMLSSSAIGALIAGHNALRAHGRKLKIEGASDGIRHLLRLMGLDRHFDIA
ncbi:MAG: STAS domain-containing protein [Fibrobacteria bacterium]|nr:STAS domain-containing protein [Fibrobacteria bacterium]